MSERYQENFDLVHPKHKKALGLVDILSEISKERKRQDDKWGPQSWPSTDPSLEGREVERLCEEYEIPTENRAKFLCENSFKNQYGSWAHIMIEEVSEAVCAKNDVDRREELIQLAAVVVAWIQDIDKKK